MLVVIRCLELYFFDHLDDISCSSMGSVQSSDVLVFYRRNIAVITRRGNVSSQLSGCTSRAYRAPATGYARAKSHPRVVAEHANQPWSDRALAGGGDSSARSAVSCARSSDTRAVQVTCKCAQPRGLRAQASEIGDVHDRIMPPGGPTVGVPRRSDRHTGFRGATRNRSSLKHRSKQVARRIAGSTTWLRTVGLCRAGPRLAVQGTRCFAR